jgi:NAD(P)-dependent dehydrogenase (short-subunit alcohol dehydrogenase family)
MAATRTALATGAARGIGRAIVTRLLADGWTVAANDADGEALEAAGFGPAGRVLAVPGDIADETAVQRVVAATLERFGRLDGVVSNAGIMVRKPVTELSLAEWRRVLDTNLTAAFLLAKHAAAPLRTAKGAIVTVASTRARMSEPDTESYSASKGGLVALTHALALSLGPDVRVNCVSPGWIHTHGEPLSGEDHAQHPAGRVGEPADVSELVAYLLDRERSGFVTGAEIVIDGGMTRKMIYA